MTPLNKSEVELLVEIDNCFIADIPVHTPDSALIDDICALLLTGKVQLQRLDITVLVE